LTGMEEGLSKSQQEGDEEGDHAYRNREEVRENEETKGTGAEEESEIQHGKGKDFAEGGISNMDNEGQVSEANA